MVTKRVRTKVWQKIDRELFWGENGWYPSPAYKVLGMSKFEIPPPLLDQFCFQIKQALMGRCYEKT